VALLGKLTGILRVRKIERKGGPRPAGRVSRLLKLTAGGFATGYRSRRASSAAFVFLVKRAWLHGSVHAWSHDLLGLQASLRPANYFPFTVVML